MIEKECRLSHTDPLPRITVLGPRGVGLTKLASVLPEVELFSSRIPRGDDSAHWIHLIALTASEYYGQNRNGDHWSIEALSHLPEGWSNDPDVDRILAKNCQYGTGTYYNAHVFPHHVNQDPAGAIGTVELVLWNPKQFWVELIIRLDKAKTAKSKVAWVLDRINRGAPFDVSMGAKVPFDMATIGDMDSYRKAQKSFDPTRHANPAAAVLQYHRLKKARDGVGIYGLSITRADYIPECKSSMGKILEDGRQIGVRNDYCRFFDISIVYIGADKVAKFISKVASSSHLRHIPRQLSAGVHAHRVGGFLKAASLKSGTVKKEGDIVKDVDPPFDEKSIRILAANDPDLSSSLLDRLRDYPDPARVLSTLSALGIVLRPWELRYILGDREMPNLHPDLFDASVASWLLGQVRRRSALLPAIRNRVVENHGFTPLLRREETQDDRYRDYRRKLLTMLEGGPDAVFDKNPDLWVTLLGRRGKVPLTGGLTKRYAELAHLPATQESLDVLRDKRVE